MRSPLEWLAKHAHGGQSRTLFWVPGGGGTVSYALFDTLVRGLAIALVDGGLRPGDRVVTQLEKSIESFALGWAVMRAGGVHVPVNTAYSAIEVAYVIDDAEPVLFADQEVLNSLLQYGVAPIAPSLRAAPTDAWTTGLAPVSGVAPHWQLPPVPRRDLKGNLMFEIPPAEAPAAMVYTSGTTGRPKGAVLTHGALAANAEALAKAWQFTGRDVLLHALPTFHVHGLYIAANTAIAAGASMVWQPKFDADLAIQAFPSVTVMMGVPTFYTRMLNSRLLTREGPKHVRLFVSGSAPMSPATHRDWLKRTGHRIIERYGMTEAGVITSHLYDGARTAGSVGRPLPGVDVRVVDPDTGQIQHGDEIGEIEVRSPSLFAGYWNDHEKTAESFRPDGFFRTGDLGRISVSVADTRAGGRPAPAKLRADERSSRELHIVGRGKDLVISGGYNVYPKEVEDAIDSLPGVAESAVIGCPHPDFGEAVLVVLTRQPGAMITEADVLSALHDRLADFKRPKRAFIVDELPRNAMGKVRKELLRKQYLATFGVVD